MKLFKKQKKLYSDVVSTTQKPKLTSVQRLITLCIVCLIKETYDNIKQLFAFIQIYKIASKFVSGFKLLLIVMANKPKLQDLRVLIASFQYKILRTLRK